MDNRRKLDADVDFIKHLKKHGGETMKKCFQCATCSVVCALSPKEYAFPRKEMIKAGWGQKEDLISDADVWLCHGCMDCSKQCPRGARPADLMGAIRSYVYRMFAKPKFMGKALSEPKHLPWLFLFSAFVIFLMVLATYGIRGFEGSLFAVSEGGLEYADFVNKLVIEAVFIPGNVLIFALLGVGLSNYWKSMKVKSDYGTPQMSFLAAVWKVLIDFLRHKHFSSCEENSNRHWGHLYAFYGFIGTMIATALVVVGEIHHYGEYFGSEFLTSISFHLPYPMNLAHPVKILGLISGLFLVVGLLLFIMKRIKTKEQEGKSVYNDLLFLWIIFGVALTGMALVFVRLSDVAWIAYATYFIHLTLVFFLLWYMPYSKFAHMPYRFLGLTYLKMHGRENKPKVFVNKN